MTDPLGALRRAPRWIVATVVAVVFIALGALTSWALGNHRPTTALASAPPSESADPSVVAAPSPSASLSPGAAPAAIVVTTAVETLTVYKTPSDSAPTRTFGKWSAAAFQPLTLLGLDRRSIGGTDWIQVSLPLRPNGQTGWVHASDVTVSSTTRAIHIYLDERELDVTDGVEVLLTTPIAVGAKKTPTPVGTFYVTDPLDFSANPSGVYGAYALGLSGFSTVLESFDGGPPQIAIHGTNQPSLIGKAVSNGCIRLPNKAVLTLSTLVSLGTPVIISQSRDDG